MEKISEIEKIFENGKVINYTGSTYQVIGDAKDNDARFLIEQYERAFGTVL